MKHEHETKEPVRIRFKDVSNGRKSIYLDIYVNGSRRYEFLRLYLLPETNKANRDKNKETMRIANAVKSQRIVDIQNGRFGFENVESKKVMLFPYIERLIAQKTQNESTGNIRCWKSLLMHLKIYERNSTFKIAEIAPQWLKGFQMYIDKGKNLKTQHRLSQNTKSLYYRLLITIIRQAIKDGILTKDPSLSVESIKNEETERQYLTIDEVRKIAKFPCGHNSYIRDAFLFSCLTGLRYSDIKKLQWCDVSDTGNGTKITFRQKKTHGVEYLYISQQARQLMGERKADPEQVFRLPVQSYVNRIVDKITQECGIRKHITFHCARHTFATMMLTLGTDIYTTSKLLGHRNVATTQIYARIVDEKKKKAVESIPEII